jgi:hypothetical protein
MAADVSAALFAAGADFAAGFVGISWAHSIKGVESP